MSHTPGPWTIIPVTINGEEKFWSISDPTRNFDVAEIHPEQAPSREEVMPNAHLIVKAPEMLEALKDVVNTFGWVDGEVRTETAKRVIAVIRAAEGK